MITGKYLENPALYSPDELERLDNHIEKYFGKATTVVHEFFSEDMVILAGLDGEGDGDLAIFWVPGVTECRFDQHCLLPFC